MTASLARSRLTPAPHAALEQAGDKIKEVGQKFADAQKMPDLGEEANELTKDGLFYTASNDNKLESDKDVRSGVVDTDKLSPDVPFSENQSKGENPGSDSTKPSIADNVKEALGGGDS